MTSPNDVTFIIPVYDLEEYRIRNLKYILPYIIDTGCKVVVSEQSSKNTSNLSELLKKYPTVKHVFYITEEKRFHKTGIINYAVKNHVDTKYAWVNDADHYMKFKNVFNQLWTSRFIQPYDIGKKLNDIDSEILISGKQLNVDYTDASVKYISLYSALSFIFHVEEFLSIGGMDETIYGWGYEDVEFSKRVKEKYYVQKMEFKGIHLWHPIEDNSLESGVKQKDMAVITCHFNWCGFENPVKNLNRFLNQMDVMGIPVYGVELSLNDKFNTKNRKNWKHITVDKKNICFQKEACINLVEKIVPKKYTKIAWIDSDLYFTNQNWYEEASEKLNTYKLIQLYSEGCHTNSSGEIVLTIPGVISVGGPAKNGSWNGHPGGALAARRELWSNGGLYVYSLMGASDTMFMNTIYGVSSPIAFDKENNKFVEWKELKSKQYLDWKQLILAYLSPKDVSHISGKFIHEWHGDRKDRNYSGRNAILQKIDFDNNIKLNSDGLLEIVNVDESLYQEIHNYFYDRKEDGEVTSVRKSDSDTRDMAVVSCFFNWCGFMSPRYNLQRFKWQMENKKIPFYGVELSLTDKFVTKNWNNWIKIKVSAKNVCFQKEACINIIEKFIPEEYKKIAWIDPDILFSNDRWYEDASEKLNTYKVVQLFSSYIATNEIGEFYYELPSIVAAGGSSGKRINKAHPGQPGAAWAANRELWLNGGLYPFSIIGGGDATFAYTIYDEVYPKDMLELSGLFGDLSFKPFVDWKSKIIPYVNKSISHIDGQIRHEWHGNHKKRQYGTRYDIVKNIDFSKSIRLNKAGLIEIVNVEPQIYDNIFEYFKNREEDSRTA